MELEFKISSRKDEDGNKYERHYCYSPESQRIYGVVDTPCHYELAYLASLEDNRRDRLYMTLESAKDYLIHSAEAINLEESSDLLRPIEGLVEEVEKEED